MMWEKVSGRISENALTFGETVKAFPTMHPSEVEDASQPGTSDQGEKEYDIGRDSGGGPQPSI